MTLEHVFDGRELELVYAKETLKYLQSLWGYSVNLVSKTRDDKSFTICCNEEKKITVVDGVKTEWVKYNIKYNN